MVIVDDNDGLRIDSYLSLKLQLSRSKIQKLIKDNKVKVNGKIINNSYKVFIDDEIVIDDSLDYDIQAIGHKEPYVIQFNSVEGIEISKGNVAVSSNIYNEEIITSRYASVIIGLEESHCAKINANDFDANDFSITISKNSNTYEINDINISQLIDSYINLVGSANICDDGEWGISISYAGNDKYNAFSDEFTINAVRYEANIIYGKSNDNIFCQLSSLTEQVQHNEECVLMICTFKKSNDDEITIINITDSDGSCVFENPLNSALEWQQYDNFIIEKMNCKPTCSLVMLFYQWFRKINIYFIIKIADFSSAIILKQ